MEKEQPFLLSDLIPEGSDENAEEVFNNNNIPICTWDKGSKLVDKANLYEKDENLTGLDDTLGSFQGMLNYEYVKKEGSEEGSEENEEEPGEDEEETEEDEHHSEDEYGNEFGNNEDYPIDNHEDDVRYHSPHLVISKSIEPEFTDDVHLPDYDEDDYHDDEIVDESLNNFEIEHPVQQETDGIEGAEEVYDSEYDSFVGDADHIEIEDEDNHLSDPIERKQATPLMDENGMFILSNKDYNDGENDCTYGDEDHDDEDHEDDGDEEDEEEDEEEMVKAVADVQDDSENNILSLLETASGDDMDVIKRLGDKYLRQGISSEDILNDFQSDMQQFSPRIKDMITTQTPRQHDDLSNIMNEYNELINYLESPRPDDFIQKPPKNKSKKDLIVEDHRIQKKSEKPKPKVNPLWTGGITQAETIPWQKFSHQEELEVNVGHDQSSHSLVPPSIHNKPTNQKKGKAKGSQPLQIKKRHPYLAHEQLVKKKDKSNGQGANQAALGIRLKQKALLAEIANKRRLEEEELLRQEMQLQLKRKKFKEALLEKALKARKEMETMPPSPAVPTKKVDWKEKKAIKSNPTDRPRVVGKGQAREDIENDEDDQYDLDDEYKVEVHDIPSNRKDIPTESHPKSVQPTMKKQPNPKNDGNEPRFLAPTTAYKNQSVQSSHKKDKEQVVMLTDQDLVKQEEEKRERVALIRRKFKEQHKKMLISLLEKNKESMKKNEEEVLQEQKKKEQHKIRNQLKIQAAGAVHSDVKPATVHHGKVHDIKIGDESQHVHLHPVDTTTSSNRLETKSAPIDVNEHVGKHTHPKLPNGTAPAAAGSALSAIRRRTLPGSEEKSIEESLEVHAVEGSVLTPHTPTSQMPSNPSRVQKTVRNKSSMEADKIKKTSEDDVKSSKNEPDAVVIDNEAAEKEKRLKRLKMRLQQIRVAAYIAAIAETKKKEENEKKKVEERKKKRVDILSNRLLLEISERKQMAQHDQLKHRQISTSLDDADIVKKVSHEKSEKPLRRKSGGIIPEKSHSQGEGEGDAPISKANSFDGHSVRKGEAKEVVSVKKSLKVSAEVAESIGNRLSVAHRQPSLRGSNDNGSSLVSDSVPARDFADWKRKNSVPIEGMVFAMTGWYPCVKQALLDRGWYFNSDPVSPFFNLKWTLKSVDIAQDVLQPWQLTNHYCKNVAITTKVGLIKSLQSLVWLADVDSNDIIPRGYDLSIPAEMQCFIDDFRCQRAEGLLKELYQRVTGLDKPDDVIQSTPNPTADNQEQLEKYEDVMTRENSVKFPVLPKVIDNGVLINPVVFDAACSVVERWMKPHDDDYIDDDDQTLTGFKSVTDLEWEIISQYAMYESVDKALIPEEAPEPIDLFLREKDDPTVKPTQAQARDKRKQIKSESVQREEAIQRLVQLMPMTEQDQLRLHNIICKIYHFNRNQFGINGMGSKSHNMWIVKPGAKSRGRGIATFMDLSKLLKYVEAGSGYSCSSQWIVQKYIENPLIIAKRKFDLRQWVLVTDWNPLTIYFYNEFYARFSVDEYSSDAQDLENSFVHLVNNSIGKNSDNFDKIIQAENGESIEGYMWSHETFKKWIQFKSGSDLVESKIQPRMKDIAKWSLMCASEMIEHRKNSWELYGFDYMVDDQFNVWLIEINSSPACDYSTSVTERYVQKALVEILSVVLDGRDWETQQKKSRGSKPDTGGWDVIYQGPILEMPVAAFGIDLSIKGEACKLPKKVFSGSTGLYLQSANGVGSAEVDQQPAPMSIVGNNKSISNRNIITKSTSSTSNASPSLNGNGLTVSGHNVSISTNPSLSQRNGSSSQRVTVQTKPKGVVDVDKSSSRVEGGSNQVTSTMSQQLPLVKEVVQDTVPKKTPRMEPQLDESGQEEKDEEDMEVIINYLEEDAAMSEQGSSSWKDVSAGDSSTIHPLDEVKTKENLQFEDSDEEIQFDDVLDGEGGFEVDPKIHDENCADGSNIQSSRDVHQIERLKLMMTPLTDDHSMMIQSSNKLNIMRSSSNEKIPLNKISSRGMVMGSQRNLGGMADSSSRNSSKSNRLVNNSDGLSSHDQKAALSLANNSSVPSANVVPVKIKLFTMEFNS